MSAKTLVDKNQKVNPIVVVGGGGHAKVVISILRKLQRNSILGYTDPEDRGSVLGVPYLGADSQLAVIANERKAVSIALGVGQIGLGHSRLSIWSRLQLPSMSFPFLASPDAIVNEEVSGGEGAVVMDGAVINTGVAIGFGTIVNTGSRVDHDAVLEDWVHIAPGATICGGVTIGKFSLIGAGATVIEGRKIVPGCVIGAGATVIRDLTEPGIYVGSPAQRVK